MYDTDQALCMTCQPDNKKYIVLAHVDDFHRLNKRDFYTL